MKSGNEKQLKVFDYFKQQSESGEMMEDIPSSIYFLNAKEEPRKTYLELSEPERIEVIMGFYEWYLRNRARKR